MRINNKPSNLKIPKFDLDLWPWNGLDGEFSVAAKEVLLIPKHRWDMTKMYWNYAVIWKIKCSFWAENAGNSLMRLTEIHWNCTIQWKKQYLFCSENSQIWSFFDHWPKCIETMLYSGRNNVLLGWKCWKFPHLTWTFDLEMTLRVNSQWVLKRYHSSLNIDEIWLKCIEIMLYSGRNNAPFRLKMLKIPKIDLDLWPSNDLEHEFSVTAKEVSLIPQHWWDVTIMYWNEETIVIILV